MTFRVRPLLLAVAALGGYPAAMALAADSITKTELRTDPPATTDRRLRDMIWQMFEQEDFRTRTPPRAPLRLLSFYGKPRATSVPNLCRYDVMTVEFAPVRHGSTHDADTPVHPVGLTARSVFHFLSPPSLDAADDEAGAEASGRQLPTDGPCAALDRNKVAFFTADDEQTARDGIIAFLKLQQALRGEASVPLDCDLEPTEKQSCRDLILGYPATAIGSVDPCDAARQEECYKISVDEREIRIVLTGQGQADVPPGRVLRARLDSFIIIADVRID